MADPLTATLRLIAGGLLIAVLVAALAFVIYLQGLGAPRTAAERDIARYRAAVEQQPAEVRNHIDLAYAYALGGRFDESLEAIDRAERMTDDPRADVRLAHADILRAAGRHADAIPHYDQAAELAEEEHAKATAERARSRIFTVIPNETLARALHGRGISKWEAGDMDGAIDDLAAAIEITPNDASMFVTLAGYQAQSGDTSSAAASYRAALQFVPDYAEAIQGLRELEEGR
ncbi:MAG: tetratricopeptide repeat protein [Coriobacteriia bacterium]